MPSPRHQELSISQRTQVKHQGLALVHNLLGLQELLTFTEQSNAPGALLRAAGAELGRGPQCFPPWEAQAAAHRSGHRQAPGLSIKSHLARVKQTQGETPGTARLTLHYVYNLVFFFWWLLGTKLLIFNVAAAYTYLLAPKTRENSETPRQKSFASSVTHISDLHSRSV